MDFSVSEPLSEFNLGIRDVLLQIIKLGKEVKEKHRQEKKILNAAVLKCEERLQSTNSLTDSATNGELRQLGETRTTMEKALQELTNTEDRLRQQRLQAQDNLANSVKQSQESGKLSDCHAKAQVSLHRDVSKIAWAKNEHGAHSVRGCTFGSSKSSKAKTFHFDERKQSDFFITNSLWALGDSD